MNLHYTAAAVYLFLWTLALVVYGIWAYRKHNRRP